MIPKASVSHIELRKGGTIFVVAGIDKYHLPCKKRIYRDYGRARTYANKLSDYYNAPIKEIDISGARKDKTRAKVVKKVPTLNAFMRGRGFDPREMPGVKLSDYEMGKYPITRAMLDYQRIYGKKK